MLCRARRTALATAVLGLTVEGAILEFGAGRGGSYAILRQAAPGRTIWVYDSWKGLPEVTLEDTGTIASPGATCNPKSAFVATLLRCGVSMPDRIVTGEIGVDVPGPIPPRIALAFCDLDRYRATAAVLNWLLANLDERGVIVVDDYSVRFPGVKRAVDEFLETGAFRATVTPGMPDDLITITRHEP